MAWLKYFYDAAQKGARAQRVTMPMFNAFWQQNKLIEMRRSEKNEQYIRYGDFRADPVKNALGTPSGKIEIVNQSLFTPKMLLALVLRMAIWCVSGTSAVRS